MVPRVILRLVSLTLVLVVSAHAGSIEFTGTAFSDRVVLNLTIVDDGGAPDCNTFWIVRNGQMQYLIQRTPGTSTYEFVDTATLPNTQYAYDLEPYYFGFMPCDAYAFESAFGDDWHGGFRVYANWGPVPIGKGRLVNTGEPWSAGVGFMRRCADDPGSIVGMAIPDEARQYVDSGQPVFVRGHWIRVSQQHGDGIRAEEVVIDECEPTAVESSTWAGVKSMYRQP